MTACLPCFAVLLHSTSAVIESYAQTLLPGLDYVQGELIVTFREQYMPEQDQVSFATRSFGIQDLDTLLDTLGCYYMEKYLSTYGRVKSEGGARLERTFLLKFRDGTDAQAVANTLLQLPHFERASLNRLLKREYGGIQRRVPAGGVFSQQWYFNYETNDSADIDAPEAWAITGGAPNVVIVIHDSGTMVDTISDSSNWKLHSDFSFYWTSEDTVEAFQLNGKDLNFTDSAGDPDSYQDNVIGYNWAAQPPLLTDPYKLQFWRSVPHDWVRCSQRLGTTCSQQYPHGTQVGSIAAAKFSTTSDIAGLAHYCRVYYIRSLNLGEPAVLDNEIKAILHAAQYADVINMSWGFESDEGLDDLKDAMDFAAADSQCVLVSITHNDSSSELVRWPAAWDNVMAVGAMNKNRTLASYSNYKSDSPLVDVVAPVDNGVVFDSHTACAVVCPSGDCSQCSPDETTTTGWGTSFAAPQVSGIAALIRSRFPAMRQDSVRSRIKRAAEWYWADTFENHAKFGSGKVNAYRSVTEWGEVPMAYSEDAYGNRTDLHRAVWGGHRSGWPDTLYVSGDLFVDAGDTLILQEGTVVRIAPEPIAHNEGAPLNLDPNRIEIVIKGTLRVLGEANDPVVFESFTSGSPTNADWAGIRFEPGSEGILSHFVVRNAVTAIKSHVPLSIENVTLSDGSEGIEAHAGVQVTTGSISNFTAYGVEVLKGHTSLNGVTITDCGMGIALGGYQQSAGDSTSVSATGCTITSPDFHGVTTSTYDHRHLALDGTEITDAYYGVALISATTADIRDCTLRRNDSGLLLLADPKAIAVRSSVIDTSTTSGVYCVNGGTNYYLGGNTIQANPVGVLCLNASPLIQNGNSITANTTGIKCDSGSSPVIEWNTISTNTTGVWTLNGSNPDLGHATGGSSIGNNTFSGNASYHVLNQTVSTTLVAENNWWGSSSGPDPGKISGSVDFDPWLTSAPGSPPSPAPPVGEDREEELVEQVPDRFDLSPGFPNPFNPSATLRVQVPPPGSRVLVVIYNVRGEAVRTLLNEYRNPGTHVLTWNGRTDAGEAAATGVYFARMRAPGFIETQKIVLIK